MWRKPFSHLSHFGLIIWLLLLWPQQQFNLLTHLEWLFLFAPLVIVPLGLGLLGMELPISNFQSLVSIILSLAFLLPKGITAVLFTLPYLLITLTISFIQLNKLYNQPTRRLTDYTESASTLFLVIGSFWTLLSQWGSNVLDFNEVMVLLTAVHFHYAGFAATILAVQVSTRLATRRRCTTLVYPSSLIGILAGIPLVAIGITISPLIELIGTLILVASLTGLAILQLTAVRSSLSPASLLLTLSALSILISMALALLYAISEYSHSSLIHIPQMIRTHGLLNAFGFTFCGLWGWHLRKTQRVL